MLLTNAFDPDPRVHNEARSLVERGYDVTLICWDRERKKPAHEVIDGIKVERIYVKSTHGRGITQMLYLGIFWLKAFFRATRMRFDIVHCHDFDTLLLGYIISILYKYKIVYDAHESYVDMLYQSLPKWLLNSIKGIEDYLIKRVDLLITVGSLLEEDFKKRGAKETCVVGNWKRLEDFNIPKEKIDREKKRLGIENKNLILSYIGWFSKQRKLNELLEAVASTPGVHLLIGGDGPEKGTVESAARNSNNITFLGYVKPDDIPLYTAISDAVVYSFDENNPNSRFSAPNKLFEAIAGGKAIISGDFGEIGKIIREEGCGLSLTATSKDKFLEAFGTLRDHDTLEKYHNNSYKTGQKKYNWSNAKNILLKSYDLLSPMSYEPIAKAGASQ